MLRRGVIVLSVLWFVALGAGALEHAHNSHHAWEDRHHSDAPVHDDSNCAVHAQLHLPLMAAGTPPTILPQGEVLAVLIERAPAMRALRVPTRLDCRGPPAVA